MLKKQIFFYLGISGAFLFCFSTFSKEEKIFSPYASLLKKVVSSDGVRWDQFGKSEKEWLQNSLKEISSASPESLSSKKAQLAFWINAHNLCVMKFILDHFPIENVMTIKGFRDQLRCSVGNQSFSLIEIQSKAFSTLQDPKTHFLLWWGVKGGPSLLPEPYLEETITQKMEEQAKLLIQSTKFVQIRHKPYKEVKLSFFFDWFKRDFGRNDEDLLGFLRKQLPKEDAPLVPSYLSQVSFFPFDWTLDRAKKE